MLWFKIKSTEVHATEVSVLFQSNYEALLSLLYIHFYQSMKMSFMKPLDISRNTSTKFSIIGPWIYVWPVNLRVYPQKKLDLRAARKSTTSPYPGQCSGWLYQNAMKMLFVLSDHLMTSSWNCWHISWDILYNFSPIRVTSVCTAWWRYVTESTLVKVIHVACHLFGAKSLPEPKLNDSNRTPRNFLEIWNSVMLQ